MEIDLKTALGERLARIRALSRAMEVANLSDKGLMHLHVVMDREIDAAIEELEADNG